MADRGQRQRAFNRVLGVLSLISIGALVFVVADPQGRFVTSYAPVEKSSFDEAAARYRARNGITTTNLNETPILYACRFPEFGNVAFSYSGIETVRRTEPAGVISVGGELALERLDGLNVKRPPIEGRLHSLPSRFFLFDRPGERLPDSFNDQYADAVDYALVDGRAVPVRRLVMAHCVRR